MHNEENTGTATLETVLSSENMREAWRSVKANDGAPGVDGLDAKRSWNTCGRTGRNRAKLLPGNTSPARLRAVDIRRQAAARASRHPQVQDRLIQQPFHRNCPALGRVSGTARLQAGAQRARRIARRKDTSGRRCG